MDSVFCSIEPELIQFRLAFFQISVKNFIRFTWEARYLFLHLVKSWRNSAHHHMARGLGEGRRTANSKARPSMRKRSSSSVTVSRVGTKYSTKGAQLFAELAIPKLLRLLGTGGQAEPPVCFIRLCDFNGLNELATPICGKVNMIPHV